MISGPSIVNIYQMVITGTHKCNIEKSAHNNMKIKAQVMLEKMSKMSTVYLYIAELIFNVFKISIQSNIEYNIITIHKILNIIINLYYKEN